MQGWTDCCRGAIPSGDGWLLSRAHSPCVPATAGLVCGMRDLSRNAFLIGRGWLLGASHSCNVATTEVLPLARDWQLFV